LLMLESKTNIMNVRDEQNFWVRLETSPHAQPLTLLLAIGILGVFLGILGLIKAHIVFIPFIYG